MSYNSELEKDKQVTFAQSMDKNFSDVENFEFTNLEGIKFSGKIANGYDAVEFIKRIISLYPNKILEVHLIYEVLTKIKNLKYMSGGTYRTLVIKNLGKLVLIEVKDFISEKGSIYNPSDIMMLSFEKIIVKVSEMQTSNNYIENTKMPVYTTGGRTCFKIVPCRHLTEAIYHYKFEKAYTYIGIRVPYLARKDGYTNLTKFNSLPLETQIKYVNENKARKGSLYNVKIELIEKENINSHVPKPNIVYIYYDYGVNLIIPAKIVNMDLKQRPILSRGLDNIIDTVYIFFDTEWNWNQTNSNSFEKSLPDFLSYTVVYGWSIITNTIENYNFEEKTNYFKGLDCMHQFLKFVSNFAKELKIREKGRKKLVCLSHNASKIENIYVLNCIATQISENYKNYSIKLKHISGTAIHSFYWGGALFIDTMLFLPGSLKDITNALCKRYKKIEFDYETKMKKVNWCDPDEEAINYAKYDTMSLAEAFMRANYLILDIVNKNNVNFGLFSLTSFRSGAAFMKWYLVKDSTCYYDQDFKNSDIGWDGYEMVGMRNMVFMGGRTECGYLGTSEDFKRNNMLVKHKKIMGFDYTSEKVKVNTAFCIGIDITSSYPHCMSSKALPGRILGTGTIGSKEEILKVIEDNKDKIVYIYANIKYLDISYSEIKEFPLLGIKLNNKLVFPNFMSGKYSVSFWDFELLAIKDKVCNEMVGEYILFGKYEGFKPKINDLFNERLKAISENNIPKSFMLKILMNSGYGSLALNPNREIAIFAKGKSIDIAIKKYVNCTIMDGPAGFKWIIGKINAETNSIIFTASYITAMARYNLWVEGVRLMNEEGAFLIYRDTDSHKFVDSPSKLSHYKQKYPNIKILGNWSLESYTDDWEIAALKVYRMGNMVKYKGITGTTEELTKDGLLVNTIEMEVWKRGRDGSIVVDKVKKRMSFKYDKGNTALDMNKGIVTPLIL